MRRKRVNKVRSVIASVCNEPWAIHEQTGQQLAELFDLRVRGLGFSDEEITDRIQAASISGYESATDARIIDGVAVIPIQGVTAPRLNMMQKISGGTSTQQLSNLVRSAINNPKVKAIVFDVNSPGGSVRGTEEAANVIHSYRGVKPMKSVITGVGFSAGYWLSSSADELIASPSSEAGSIGVLASYQENSKAIEESGVKVHIFRSDKNKALASGVEPLSEDLQKQITESIAKARVNFHEAVARNRGISAQQVADTYGQGKTFYAKEALEIGMVDRVATLEEVIGELAKTATSQNLDSQAAEASGVSILEKGIERMSKEEEILETVEELSASVTEVVKPQAKPEAVEIVSAVASAQEKAEMRAAERERQIQIKDAGDLWGISDELVSQAIASDVSYSDALVKFTEEKAGKMQPVSKVKASVEGASEDKFKAAATEALTRRCGLGADTELNSIAKDLEHRSIMQIAEESVCIASGNSRLTGVDPDDIAQMALGGQVEGFAATGWNRPGDFPNIMSALANKVMVNTDEYNPSTYKQWTHQIPSVPDFKPKTMVQVGEFGEFPLLEDGKEFEDSTMGEAANWISVDRYGDKLQLTVKMMINDDLGAFMDSVSDKQLSHDLTLNRLCVNLLTGNVTLPDNIALFHSSHGNETASGNPVSETELAKQRLLLRKQTGVSGKRKLNQTVKWVLIPEDLETTTERVLSGNVPLMPTTASSAEVFRGKVGWIVEPMLGEDSAAKWYALADPRIARSIVVAHQRGFERMKTTNYYDNATKSRVFDFEGRFAAAVRSANGITRNAGSGA